MNSPAMKPRRSWLTPRLQRDLHLFIAIFFAPTILFFSITGALQEFSLHESGDGYTPPPVIEKLGQVHIHQRYQLKPKRPAPPAATNPAGAKPAAAPAPTSTLAKAEPKKGSTLGAKIFFAATAIGLALASLLGLWIGLTQGRLRKPALILTVLGVVIPIALIALQ
jgi:hypothetical protein